MRSGDLRPSPIGAERVDTSANLLDVVIGEARTRQYEQLDLERKLVVVFDICSSTSILEDLKQTDNIHKWRDLLIRLKEDLLAESSRLHMQLYKFIGDGWILLFPADISSDQLLDFLSHLSMLFDVQFDSQIYPVLQRTPIPIGLTFGIDAGELVRLEMKDQTEYVGRALNVASRLQSATRELPGDAGYRALFAKHAYNSLPPPFPADREQRAKVVPLPLRNLGGTGILAVHSHGQDVRAVPKRVINALPT